LVSIKRLKTPPWLKIILKVMVRNMLKYKAYLTILLIAISAVSIKALKAPLSNPVKSLGHE